MDNKINEFSDTLKKDLEAAKKSRTMTIVVGVVFFLIVFFVFMSLAGTVKKNVTPDALADVASYTTRQMVKKGRPVVEKAFKEHIPIFLKNLRMSLLNDLIPALRKQLQTQLQDVIEKSFLSSSRAFTDAVKEAVAKAKPIAAAQGDPPPDVLANLILREFKVAKEKRYTDAPMETLGAQFEQSKTMLDGLNKKLLLLTSHKKPQNREEALEMNFIRAWVSLISPGNDDSQPPGLGK
ncbi:MAG: hypothetical protein GXP54_13300 [Deltaproteobacteria bacterium]|nr:hypothetical protein [Deltaproteobacteria bacterium]